jgi:hypothetical protein
MKKKTKFKRFFSTFFALETQIKDKKEKPNFFSAKKIDFRARASEKKNLQKILRFFVRLCKSKSKSLIHCFKEMYDFAFINVRPERMKRKKKLQKKSLKKNFSRR